MSRRRRPDRGALLAAALCVLAGAMPALMAAGCAATAIVATVVVVKMLTPHGYKLTIKAEERPRALYNGLVRVLKRDHPDIRVAEEDQSQRYFEARWTEGGTGSRAEQQWVSFVVQTLPDETSELVIAMGYGENRRADYREWALERIDVLMAELGVAWKVASAAPGQSEPRLAGVTLR